MSKQEQHFYEFDAFRLDTVNRVLLRGGEVVPLKRKALETLMILVEHNREVLEKDEMMTRVWPDSFVEESNLTQYIYMLRKALGEGSQGHNYIETIPGRGYRFNADIRELSGEGKEMVIETHTHSRVVITKEDSNSQEIIARTRESSAEAIELRKPSLKLQDLTSSIGRHKKGIAVIVPLLILAIAGIIIYQYSRQNAFPGPASAPARVAPFTSYPGSESAPSFSPDGRQIAFVWDGGPGGNMDIYVKLIDVGTPLRLTADPALDHCPVWSPDGRYIAFMRRQSIGAETIVIVPALGGTERRLGQVADGLDWSPDGQYLAVTDRSSQSETNGIFVISIETGERRRITSPPTESFGDSHPAFSPDGKSIAFFRPIKGGVEELFVVPISGGEPRRLTFDNRRIYSLAWAPKGHDIIFSSDRDGTFHLWSVSAAGGAPERVTSVGAEAFDLSVAREGSLLAYTQMYSDTNIWRFETRQPSEPGSTQGSRVPIRLITSSRHENSPEYSPDGKRIVFASDRSGSAEIWECDSDGTNPVQLTNFGGPVTGSPRYSPDGQQIAFDSRPGGQADIYVISAEGGKPRRLTMEDSTDVVPSWSRDGKWIYLSSNRSGDRQIWKVPAEGGNATQVTRGGGFEAFESPEGKYLYYTKERNIAGIWRLPVDGGEETIVPELHGVRNYRYWVVGRSGIYFVPEKITPRPTINFFDFATGRVTEVAWPEKPPMYGPGGLAVSPDGHWILYTQEDQISSDIMLVTNFH